MSLSAASSPTSTRSPSLSNSPTSPHSNVNLNSNHLNSTLLSNSPPSSRTSPRTSLSNMSHLSPLPPAAVNINCMPPKSPPPAVDELEGLQLHSSGTQPHFPPHHSHSFPTARSHSAGNILMHISLPEDTNSLSPLKPCLTPGSS
jgi:hypothetical protein